MPDDLICVQLGERGKWHPTEIGNTRRTACGLVVEPTARQKYLSLIDSKERCRHDKCIAARNSHAGRV